MGLEGERSRGECMCALLKDPESLLVSGDLQILVIKNKKTWNNFLTLTNQNLNQVTVQESEPHPLFFKKISVGDPSSSSLEYSTKKKQKHEIR